MLVSSCREVERATLDDRDARPEVGSCIVAALSSWQFPRPVCSPAIVKQRFEAIRG